VLQPIIMIRAVNTRNNLPRLLFNMWLKTRIKAL